MVINKKRKTLWKISIIDILFALVLIFIISGTAYKYSKAKSIKLFTKSEKLQIVFFCEEMPGFSTIQIKKDDIVFDSTYNIEFGNVKDIKIDKAISYGVSKSGENVQSSKPNYVSASITVEGDGVYNTSGDLRGVTFKNRDYWVGKVLEFKVGKVAMYGKITEVKKQEEQH